MGSESSSISSSTSPSTPASLDHGVVGGIIGGVLGGLIILGIIAFGLCHRYRGKPWPWSRNSDAVLAREIGTRSPGPGIDLAGAVGPPKQVSIRNKNVPLGGRLSTDPGSHRLG